MKDWTGSRILMIGGARQGVATGRFLARRGAFVTINDQRPPEQMEAAQQSLADLSIDLQNIGPALAPSRFGKPPLLCDSHCASHPYFGESPRTSEGPYFGDRGSLFSGQRVQWHFGEHPLSLLDGTDLVCVSGGVPLTLPIIAEAFRRGMPVTNDSQIFMEAVPCRVIGITGSAGKTTTTTLVSRMAQAALQPVGGVLPAHPSQVWVGGNIGLPLIDHLDEIGPSDLVVLELSSFQLELMTRSPQVGVVLNITPNHLDRHGTMEAYTAAKARILAYQSKEDVAVLDREDPGSWSLSRQSAGRLVSFGFQRPAAGQTGTFIENDQVMLQAQGSDQALFSTGLVRLRGRHNLLNVLAACAIASSAGFPSGAMAAGVEGFNGVPHRLEWVRTWNGAQWFNDSIATAPERTMAAIRSFNEPLVLLLGGRDKALPWGELADLVHQRVDHVVVFGEAAPKILQALGPQQNGQRPFTLDQYSGLQDAVQAAAQVAGAGDVVLLSPGGTSYDEFNDFEERGERFRIWVKQLS